MSQIFQSFQSPITGPRQVTNNQSDMARLDKIERQLETLVAQLAGLAPRLPDIAANAATAAEEISWNDYLAKSEAGQIPSFDGPGEGFIIINNFAEPVGADQWVLWADYLAAEAA